MQEISKKELRNEDLSDPERSCLRAVGSERELPNGTFGTTRLENDKLEPVAVIGFAARLPQDATTPESFWQMLCEGRSARTEIPQDRLNIDAFYHPDPDRIDAVSLHVLFHITEWHEEAHFS